MTESTLSSNLQQLMRIHGNLSVSELARLTTVPQPTIHHVLFGSTKRPRKHALEALSNFFSVTIAQLVGDDELPQIIPETIKEDLQLRTVPIIAWDSLKTWPQGQQKHEKEILLDRIVSPHAFALIVKDPTIEPIFPQNTLLIFDVKENPQDRDFVVARLNGDDTIMFNRLFVENNMHYLKQTLENGDVKLIKLNMNFDEILGILIEARIQY